ncbi:hypothetical protein C1N92_20230 [Bacillus velezensis]|uniref:hypothetical protein n=1 Tax=Bacillus TaxID=1386 RepID=UPI0003A2561B|nr:MULTISPECIES: hypothetical protein [Bacillus]AUS16119.1 hypothetical protein C0W57_07990 [Bacillus velezensis]AWQ17031.1 hypothetical protein C1N92_20230 [Bacillus velezensis]UHC66457.1 hypothetical protein K3G25_07625 [Bacillus sp. FCW2]URD66506.1 hypothetical protein M8X21_21845 [Bacillus velezensis]WED88449.1 hypothetical protein PXG99_04990 [Bacillus velezensis]
MDTNIRVKVMYDDTVYNKWGEIIDAILNEDTEEYFGKDHEGREVFVASLDMYGELVLEPGFKLVDDK